MCEHCLKNDDLTFKVFVGGKDNELCANCIEILVCGKCNIPLGDFSSKLNPSFTTYECKGCNLTIHITNLFDKVLCIRVENGSLRWSDESK